MLDKYSPEQLKVIIQNIAPSGFLDWAEELDKDLTDPLILRRYRCYMDGLRDFFTKYYDELFEIMKDLKKKFDKETVIEKMMGYYNLNHYEAKLYVESNWEQ